MRAKNLKRSFMVVVMFFLAAALCFAAPQGEDEDDDGDDQANLPEVIEMLLETPQESTDTVGFGIIADLSRLSDNDRKGLQIELDPIYGGDYLNDPAFFGSKEVKAIHPLFLLFNLDINYGDSNRSFNVENVDDTGVIIYVIQKGIRIGMEENPAMYYYVDDDDIKSWFSHSGWLSYQGDNKDNLQNIDMFFSEFSDEGRNGVSWYEIRKWPSNDRIIGIDER